jgi:hypothetical protein
MSRKEGMAIVMRMRIGTTVHATSRAVLWVIFEGVGLALALKRTHT